MQGIAKTCALLLSVICTAHATEPVPFKATFDIRIAPLGAATAVAQLELNDDRLLYTSTITPRGLISKLSGDTLHFTAQMRYENGRVIAEEYSKTHARNTKKDQRYRFETHGRSVEILKKGRVYFLEAPTGTLDEVSMQLQMILDAHAGNSPWHYTLVSNGKLKRYRLVEVGGEIITTALGNIETIRIERTRLRGGKNDTIDLRYWLSPTHHYLPIKVERLKDGKAKGTITIKAISLANAEETEAK